MSSFQVVDSSPGCSVSIMETSNFAHVIFQNVGKSFLPQAPLECRYTLTPYITPHPKDWVGIFKVGWSTARDYYTFLWSPMPENYEPGSTVHRTVVFQGYYVPKSDGEFYQFCYVTHAGDIRGASTPFQFRPATPTEELLTVTEEDSNSDILVVTTKTGLLERVEEAQQERRELLKAMRLLHEEKQQLQEEQKQLVKEREQERETCCLLRTHNQELLRSSQGLSDEREEVRRRLAEAKDRVRQLEEDLLGVTQRGLQKETELDCLRERLKKLTAERDNFESQLKNEKDERDLYKAHLRSAELENTKLSAELQMLKAVELNREVTIAQFQEELERLRGCVAQRDSLERELLAHKHDKAELTHLREQLHRAEEQLQASRQQATLLASELRDSASARDHTMTELYRARIEADKLHASLADAQAECQRMESQLDRMRSTAQKEVGVGTSGDGAHCIMVVSEAEAELQREVEELKLRLHMAAEHYKEKYRECQRLRRQVAKLSTAESQGVIMESKKNVSTETTQEPLISSPESPTEENSTSAVLQEAADMTITPEVRNEQSTYAEAPIGIKVEEIQREKSLQEATVEAGREEQQVEDRESGDKDCEKEEKKEENLPEESLRMASWVEVSNERLSAEEKSEAGVELTEEEAGDNAEDQEPLEVEERSTGEAEKDQTRSVEAELAVMEEKWRVQCVINDTLKQRLADEEGRFRVQMAERAIEVSELKQTLAQVLKDKEQLQEELQRYKSRQRELEAGVQGAEAKQTMVLRYPLPYPQDPSPPPLVPQRPAELQYGNPYSTETSKDRLDVILSPEHLSRPPPEAPLCAAPCAPPVSPPSPSPGAPGWDQEVVCIQPSRSTTPPENMEAPAEEAQKVCDRAQQPCDHPSSRRSEVRSSFCFDSSTNVHKRCPLCEVIFPPHFEQRSFEQHVESHWKVCPVCSEQFPLNCQQQLFEKHVLTHFDGNVLNFEQIE
ncbi:tax1-binding protein 1 homolog A isoform X1 [Girardinichthys multiradiatus]|nr:tax1-binding protein 1 homolog A isoform X1 [Girardinichthys multiradiatus]XP_047239706.1 tax1-binding protein 1 homolog A isoform X1 [Girardinichthys multiradiatus]XP_047239707.1 tax1-binding protein 1 homolog A isoform X1 [Girardinichthys multiradiatus]XP_047239708.1 tax1-binding protein 1 homolog A isoform X1 [Girardinichthys multiradiatus]XP_047239709.1 tax1-binding protein 1 homolog A isoform X1 [Girardinichthys multiradiatus]XP_047239710.1 tax1-binding protein 1 homolog A isoform X1 [